MATSSALDDDDIAAYLPPGALDAFASAKAAYEAQLAPTAIDPAWGYEWALCCGYGCDPDNCTCECANLPI